MSILQRKNPLGLIKAFKKAFKPRDKAVLVLKCSHADEYPAERKALDEAAKDSSVVLINQILSREDTNSLVNLCDSYVSLHRSEGFGLTMAEAMSLGKPVIATGYSGNLDFMTPLNSFLVNHRLVTLDQDYSPYPKGSVWADPDQDHAAELMRFVYENRKAAREIGREAQKDVQEKLGEAAVGAIIRERIATLAELGKLSVPDEFMKVPERTTPKRVEPEYQRLVGQMQKLARSATPPAATVMVISKGDEQLVKLAGRQGWHFPQQEDGAYAGYHPNDSAAAIGHLEVLRAKGGQFLLIPRTAFWWLDYYADFRKHLDKCYRRARVDENGILYEVSKPIARAKAPMVRVQEQAKRRVNGAVHPDLSTTNA